MNRTRKKRLSSAAGSLFCATLLQAAVTSVVAAPLEDPIHRPIKQKGPQFALETVATGLTAPNWGTAAPGIPGRLFVTDQTGIIWNIDLESGEKTVFADVSGLLVELGAFGPGTFDERGLLGLAFHPGYAENGLLYTYTSEPAGGVADFPLDGVEPNHESVVTEWQVPDPSDPESAVEPTSRRVLLRIEQPQFNHNAGALSFGPDDLLYVALGDGGGADDQGPGHSPQGNGQDPSNILGNILRIDPDGSNAENGQYGIPDDNPFFPGGDGPYGGAAGCDDGVCDEIYAWGFRNPFRFSFDRATGDLYAADVGQNDIEEVDVVVAGGNYGWRIREGSFCFDPNGADPGFVTDEADCGPEDLIDPVAEYDHDEGIAVVGGFVYRGSHIPPLRGRYVFGDFARSFGEGGRLFYLGKKNIVKEDRVKTSKIKEMRIAGGLGLPLLGFGQDAMGELYVLANGTAVPFGETGVVLKIVRAHGKGPGDAEAKGKTKAKSEHRAEGKAKGKANGKGRGKGLDK